MTVSRLGLVFNILVFVMSSGDSQPVSNRRFTVFEIVATIVAAVVMSLISVVWYSHVGVFDDHKGDFDKHIAQFERLNEKVQALTVDMAVIKSQVDQNTRAVEANSQKLDQVLIALAKIDQRLAEVPEGGAEERPAPEPVALRL